MKLFNTITVITVSSALMLGGCITYPDGTQKQRDRKSVV